MVGSSRNSSSGSPTSAHASASRCFCPPDSVADARVALLLELHERDRCRAHRDPCSKKLRKSVSVSSDRQLVGELRLLQLDAEPLSEARTHQSPSAGRGPRHRRRRGAVSPSQISIVVVLPAPFGPEQAEALAGRDIEIDAVDGDDVLEHLPEPGDAHRRRSVANRHPCSVAEALGAGARPGRLRRRPDLNLIRRRAIY